MTTRVLFIDHTAKLGGGEIFLLNLLPELAGHISPVVILLEDGPLRLELERRNIEVYVFEVSADLVASRRESLACLSKVIINRGLASVNTAVKLSRFISLLKVDIVHTNSLKACVVGGIASRLARKPLIWHIHDRISEEYLPKSMVKLIRVLIKVMPHAVIANSEATLGTLNLRYTKHGVVVYPGTVVCEPVPQPPIGSPIRIGIIGRLSQWKGQHIFLEVAARVLQTHPNTEWVIVGAALFGEDEYCQQLEDRASRIDLAGHITFRGFQSDVVTEMCNLDIIMHCSILPEPFGQVITEAMALAKPVIASRAGGVLEIIEDTKSGVLVEMGDVQGNVDAVTRLLEDRNTANHLGKMGRSRVLEHFTIQKSANAVLDLYKSILPTAFQSTTATESSLRWKFLPARTSLKERG
jgi:glycosyltransferase involved in cell wall biosynthesis